VAYVLPDAECLAHNKSWKYCRLQAVCAEVNPKNNAHSQSGWINEVIENVDELVKSHFGASQ
jgi:hypothetical protein